MTTAKWNTAMYRKSMPLKTEQSLSSCSTYKLQRDLGCNLAKQVLTQKPKST